MGKNATTKAVHAPISIKPSRPIFTRPARSSIGLPYRSIDQRGSHPQAGCQERLQGHDECHASVLSQGAPGRPCRPGFGTRPGTRSPAPEGSRSPPAGMPAVNCIICEPRTDVRRTTGRKDRAERVIVANSDTAMPSNP